MTSQTEADQAKGLDLSAYTELFLEEARKFLTILRQSLSWLTDHPDDRTARHEAHRAAHTLKGMASTMRYEALAVLAKGLETPFLSDSPLAPDEINVLRAGCEEFEHGLERLAERDRRQ